MGAMIAHKRSLIAQLGFIYPLLQTIPIKFHPSNFFARCAADFITQSRQTKAQFQIQ
jgi:hypothetical protein